MRAHIECIPPPNFNGTILVICHHCGSRGNPEGVSQGETEEILRAFYAAHKVCKHVAKRHGDGCFCKLAKRNRVPRREQMRIPGT